MDDILTRTEKLHGVTVKQIEKIVKTNDKQRFALEKDENGRLMIRANQGHTMEVGIYISYVVRKTILRVLT